MMDDTIRRKAAQAVRDCLDHDQADNDYRPVELWIADSVLSLAPRQSGFVLILAIFGAAALIAEALYWGALVVLFLTGAKI